MKRGVGLTAECWDCGWKYGPGVQVDVLEQAKRHRKECKAQS